MRRCLANMSAPWRARPGNTRLFSSPALILDEQFAQGPQILITLDNEQILRFIGTFDALGSLARIEREREAAFKL